jgi:hypothetical protein
MLKNPDIFLSIAAITCGSLVFGMGVGGLYCGYKPNSMLFGTIAGYITTLIGFSLLFSALAEINKNQNKE